MDFIYKAFGSLLLWFYEWTGSYGVALILFATVAKLILLPFQIKGKRGMLDMQLLQPKQAELQKKYAKDKDKYNQAVQKLYEEEGVKPMSGCLWNLLPFPIILVLFKVLREPLSYLYQFTAEQIEKIAQFVTGTLGTELAAAANYQQLDLAQYIKPNQAAIESLLGVSFHPIDFTFLGLNLSRMPSLEFNWMLLIPIVSAITSFVSMWLSTRSTSLITGTPPQKGTMMTYLLGPGMSLWFGFIMPAGISIYWIAQNMLTVAQEYAMIPPFRKIFEKQARERALREQRRLARIEREKEEKRLAREEELRNKTKGKKFKVAKNAGALIDAEKAAKAEAADKKSEGPSGGNEKEAEHD